MSIYSKLTLYIRTFPFSTVQVRHIWPRLQTAIQRLVPRLWFNVLVICVLSEFTGTLILTTRSIGA